MLMGIFAFCVGGAIIVGEGIGTDVVNAGVYGEWAWV